MKKYNPIPDKYIICRKEDLGYKILEISDTEDPIKFNMILKNYNHIIFYNGKNISSKYRKGGNTTEKIPNI